MIRRTDGFTLLVSVLVLVTVLVVIVGTASIVSLGTRRDVSDERVSYQALLAAESGINAFQALSEDLAAQKQGFPGATLSVSDLNQWLGTVNMTPVSLSDNLSVTLDFASVRTSPSPLVTLRSRGSVVNSAGDTIGEKVVLQDFDVLSSPDFNLGGVPAALTSWPDVKVAGNAIINGEVSDPASADGMIHDVAEVGPGGSSITIPAVSGTPSVDDPFTIPVTETSLFREGSYVQIDGETFRVTSIGSGSITVHRLATNGPELTITPGDSIGLYPFAVTVPISAGDASLFDSTTTIRVTDPTGFTPGLTVYLKSGANTYAATVDSVSQGTTLDTKTVTVSWIDGPPPEIHEGDPFVRDIQDAVSAGDITVTGAAQACETEAECTKFDNSLGNPFTDDGLFRQIFGTDYATWSIFHPATSVFDGNLESGSIVNLDHGLNGGVDLCGGPGILVVDGDLTVNGTCDGGFRGLVYVRGKYRQQGNSTITGAVVAEGSAEFGNPSDDSTVSGTGQGEAKIGYDEGALLAAGMLLSGKFFAVLPGTWRQATTP